MTEELQVGALFADAPATASSTTLDARFRAVARRHADRIAVSDHNVALTYAELDRRSDTLARVLRAVGVGRDRRTALSAVAGVEMVVGMLAVLKAGGAYVPVDPALPETRRRALIERCDAPVVVADPLSAPTVPSDVPVLATDATTPPAGARVDQPWAGPSGPSGLAYVIFTSGSSGTPKGVLVEHRNVVRLFDSADASFDLDETDVWTCFHSSAFDFSVWEIWGALLHGARLVLVPRATARDPEAFRSLLADERVTVLSQTPSAFRHLVAADARCEQPLEALRHVVLGGERLDVKTVGPWVARYGLAQPRLTNMYGITETTVHVTVKPLGPADLVDDARSPIGVPLADLEIEVLDEDGRRVPDGTPGVLHVAGAGLARGYLDRPDLTGERFVERADADGTTRRWYVTGDVGVRDAEGAFAYVGRADRQLKVRGYRIEPGEIEACLRAQPVVGDCVVDVVDFADGDPRLVAWVVPVAGGGDDGAPWAEELRAHAAQRLPGYMVPSACLVVPELPITVNGKLDTTSLTTMVRERADERPTAAPAVGSEEVAGVVRGIWAAVLAREVVGDDDEFFDLGGTSFSLIEMLRTVNERFGVRLEASVLAEDATAKVLANAVSSTINTEKEIRNVR